MTPSLTTSSNLPLHWTGGSWFSLLSMARPQASFSLGADGCMNAKLRLFTLGVGCFAAGFLTCCLSLPQPRSASRLPGGGPAVTTAPVVIGTGATVATGIVAPTNIVIRGPDRWQWADGTVHDSPPPNSGQRDLGLIETRPQAAPGLENPK